MEKKKDTPKRKKGIVIVTVAVGASVPDGPSYVLQILDSVG